MDTELAANWAHFVGAFVDGAVTVGLTQVVVSPGSRSTPLAVLLAAHAGIRVWMHVDERSAGYFALGMAKARGEPVALLCSSGTAAANYLPAIVEAHYGEVPLIVLTADRPHELRDVGAPQAIDQLGLYGRYAKWFVDMAPAEDTSAALRYARTVAERAVTLAAIAPAGAVHLNFPFREPLVPVLSSDIFGGGRRRRAGATPSLFGTYPGVRRLSADALGQLAGALASAQRGLVVVGPIRQDGLAEAVVALAERLGWPVLADPLSSLRNGEHDLQNVIDGYDASLRDATTRMRLQPDLVLRIGPLPISKALANALDAWQGACQVVVDGSERVRDPGRTADAHVFAEPTTLVRELTAAVAGRPVGEWLKTWQSVNRIVELVVTRLFDGEVRLSEGGVFRQLRQVLADATILYVGNSMPVRDLDTFFGRSRTRLRTMANRGANGIDGVVSSALGAASTGPVVLVVGDLSFYHDLNGLLPAKLYSISVTVVVVNNNGGGIFSFLPQATMVDDFEALFGTPLGLDYERMVTGYGGHFQRIEEAAAFGQAVRSAQRRGGLNVIEVMSQRTLNRELHRQLWKAVEEDLAAHWKRVPACGLQ